jgi:putative membrane protein
VRRLSTGERAVLAFTLAYVSGFTAWFIAAGDHEFLLYVATMAALIALVGLTQASAAFPAPLLWALSLWGLAHMAGGGVTVGDGVLYNLVLVPIAGTGELTILKYDQLVHAYGFGVTAWALWHLARRHYPVLAGGWTLPVYAALGAMGLGAVNEIIEFVAVLSVPDTNVGGYLNTGLDLVFNALGAVLAVAILTALQRRAPA